MHKSLNILVAEDSEDDVFFLKTALKRAGIKNAAHFVADGSEAIDYLSGKGKYKDRREFPFPNVMLTDLKMPRLDGFEVLKWLRENSKCSLLPIMVLSTSLHEGDIQQAYKLGANAYLAKPSTLTEYEKMLQVFYDFWAQCQKPALDGI